MARLAGRDPLVPSVFRKLEQWSSILDSGFSTNFVGQKIDLSFNYGFDGNQTQNPPVSDKKDAATFVKTKYPPPQEETFEWIALLEALEDAGDNFVMAELGAGYGRWVISAACAARMFRPKLCLTFITAEAEPAHFAFMEKHFRDNGLEPADHTLFRGVVNKTGEPTHFVIGHPGVWYGQAIVPEGYTQVGYPESHTIEVAAVRLRDLLAGHSRVDLVDMDIQGAEEEVVMSEIDFLTARARRISIGTHSQTIHQNVGDALAGAGWIRRYSYPPLGKHLTDFGPIDFNDGIQYWVNPAVRKA